MKTAVDKQKKRRIQIKRGEICISSSDLLCASISSCVSVCLYHPGKGIGGMTHISRSRTDDTTPSGRFLVNHGFYYADTALEALLEGFREHHPYIIEKNIESFLIGGIDSEGPVSETLEVLKHYRFREIGADINKKLFRHIVFDTGSGTVSIRRNAPFSENRKRLTVNFSSPPDSISRNC